MIKQLVIIIKNVPMVKEVETWSEQIESFMGNKTRLDMLNQLNNAGLIKNNKHMNIKGRMPLQ